MTFGWVRSRFRFLSFVLIVYMLSSDFLWANPTSFGSAVEHSACPSFSGFGRIEKISSQDFKAGSLVVYRIFKNPNSCSVPTVPINCARVRRDENNIAKQ